jgi:hypothetical protein
MTALAGRVIPLAVLNVEDLPVRTAGTVGGEKPASPGCLRTYRTMLDHPVV